MGGFLYGYARTSIWKGAPTLVAQGEAIAGYAAARGWPFDPDRQLFGYNQAAHKLDFRDREAGGALFGCLRHGDHVIVASLDRMILKSADAASILGLWSRLGVALHLVDLGRPVHQLDAATMAGAMAAIEKAARTERAAATAAQSRYYGRPVNGASPYGKRWVRQPGTKEWELVPDEEERQLMGALLKMHEAGISIDRIRLYLTYEAKLLFYKQRGRKKMLVRWNKDAIWRRIQAEKRLREAELAATVGVG